MKNKQLPPAHNSTQTQAHLMGPKMTHAEVFVGLLPPPSMLQQYKALDPDILPFFMEMAKKEQESRLARNKDEAECKKQDLAIKHFGQKAGVFLVCLLSFCGLIALFLHAFTVAGVIFGTTILSLFSARIFTNSKK